jgi:aminoglycoside phosphotransferase (APT) family kinase protein
MPIALIDFDAARIGSRRDDVGYATWLWLDLGNPSLQPSAQGRRLALFFDEYGMAVTDAIEAVLDAQDSLAGRNVARPEIREWAIACHDFVTGHATALDAGIVDHVASIRSRSTMPQAMSPAR